jgi:hypothetical protein
VVENSIIRTTLIDTLPLPVQDIRSFLSTDNGSITQKQLMKKLWGQAYTAVAWGRY